MRLVRQLSGSLRYRGKVMTAHPTRRRFLLALAAALPVLAAGAWPVVSIADDDDHERARRLLRSGEIRPLSEILASVESSIGGRVLDVDFERDDGRYVYELKMVMPSGRVREVTVDAATARIIEIEDD
ncbi:PepSY domain-containing protein [Stappia sp. 28M-7]|nr:PepSY domain-containing protein [Stappia sp. 28M-7]